MRLTSSATEVTYCELSDSTRLLTVNCLIAQEAAQPLSIRAYPAAAR